MDHVNCDDTNIFITLFTDRKRSSGKVMFSKVSVCPHGGSVSLIPCPYGGWVSLVSGPEEPGVDMSRGGRGYLPDTGPGVDIQTWDTTGYGWQMDGTYPTGMLSVFYFFLNYFHEKFEI